MTLILTGACHYGIPHLSFETASIRLRIDGALCAVIAVNALDDRNAFERPAEIINYEGESAPQRQAPPLHEMAPATLDAGEPAR